ncbi:MAG: hypothetical protein KAS40_24910 [Desulfobacterales bacterium]|nr:hypothetical protein [Desulfobacterales bacterium]
MGLVDLIYPSELFHEEVQNYAESLVQKPAEALAAIRRTITEGGAVSFNEGLKIEYETAVKLAGTKDFAEGIHAFLQKAQAELGIVTDSLSCLLSECWSDNVRISAQFSELA